MLALAGCTAMDVVSILEKMRVELDDFNVYIESELADEHPKLYTKMHIIYEFKGKDLPVEKLEKAINLSLERYCGVHATLQKALNITHEIRIV
jgi:putative redox protein